MSAENEQIIELIANHTKILLENHWPNITDCRNGDESIKIGFSYELKYKGQKRIIESGISFGKRVKDSIIGEIDTEQLDLELTGQAPAKRSRKKKTNIIESAIIGGNESFTGTVEVSA